MRILIAEDEKKLADALVQIFARERITADVFYNGTEACDNAQADIYDVIVLDIMLPGMDGISILRELRKEGISTPVMMLTAKDALSDKVRGLDSGADDYMTKPFQTEELVARVRALARRSSSGLVSSDELVCGDITLSTSSYELTCGSNSIKLGLKEFSVMELLIRNCGSAVSKDMLITKIWGYESEAEDNNVEVYISFLRKKLGFLGSKTAIRTLRGIGYTIDKS
ncbi:MAG: response regulator transcription factor [Oscillospiraceae bacterium]|nr:response regulator transcription factor [Oscillospiraceae bacterium]